MAGSQEQHGYMKNTTLTKKELIEEMERLQRISDNLRMTNQDLELLLAEKSSALEKLKRELEDRLAAQIRMESACRLNAEKYLTLISNIPGVVYRCANDAAWTMQFISSTIEEISGYPASDFLDNAVRTYSSIIHGDDVMLVVNAVQNGLVARRPYVVEYRIKHQDGSIRWVYEKGRGVFDKGGEFLWLDGVIFDISDRIPATDDHQWRISDEGWQTRRSDG